MPKVHTAVARKDYPDAGIKKGDTYYSWSFYRGPTQRSKTYPRQSQLTASKLSGAYAAMETLEDQLGGASDLNDVTTACNDAVEALREVASEFEEAISNMESAFAGGSPQIDEHNEQKDAIELCAEELESAVTEIENLDACEYVDADAEVDGKKGQDREVTSLDDLTDDEKAEMLQAARDVAGAVELSV